MLQVRTDRCSYSGKQDQCMDLECVLKEGTGRAAMNHRCRARSRDSGKGEIEAAS